MYLGLFYTLTLILPIFMYIIFGITIFNTMEWFGDITHDVCEFFFPRIKNLSPMIKK